MSRKRTTAASLVGLLVALQGVAPALAQNAEQGTRIQAMWWARGTAWEAHLRDVIHQLFVCRASQPVMDRSPCNYLVGEFLNRVYQVEDFNTATGFLTADQIVSRLYTSGSLWREIGAAHLQPVLTGAQERANSGAAVIAVYPSVGRRPGHVAIILPGRTLRSNSWDLDVPNSASFFLDAPQRSYVGRGLSNAFAAHRRGDVRIFYRVGARPIGYVPAPSPSQAEPTTLLV